MCSIKEIGRIVSTISHYSFSKSKYFHLVYSADLRIYLLLDNEIDRKIDATVMQFLLVQNRQQTHDSILIGSGANEIHMHVRNS